MTKLPDSLIQYLRERREQEAALGYRGYGKKQVADALAKIAGALKGVDDPAVHSFDEESLGLLRLLDQVADPDQYDSRIPTTAPPWTRSKISPRPLRLLLS